ncbi:uncharacterized protein LOC127833944 isoform X2 [Dreissena polymorpha]|nr:uncharacterized protein LOC127833944 isoform X2 [Dreissena polymorpha]
MGAIYLHHCDIEKMIPIYLIVSGVVPLLFGSLIVNSSRRRDEDENVVSGSLDRLCCAIQWGMMAFLIHTIWLICGTIWVYSNYWTLTSNHVTCSQNVIRNCVQGTCNMTFLKFAFSMVTIDWICLAIVVISLMICWRALKPRRN